MRRRPRTLARRAAPYALDMFVARPPAPPLDTAVAVLWSVRAPRRPRQFERVLPQGTGQLVVNLTEDRTRTYEPRLGLACVEASGTVICGPRTGYMVIDTDEQHDCVGASLTPTGLSLLLRERVDTFADADISLDAIWPASAVDRLRTRLLEAHTQAERLDVLEHALRQRWRPLDVHPAVATALEVFITHPAATRVDAVVARSGYSARHLVDRFTAQVGMPPKRFCRVRRFQLALQRAFAGAPDDWASLALECGFADQSHLVNEFRAFSGLPPTGYLDRRTPWPNHVRFLQDDRLPGR